MMTGGGVGVGVGGGGVGVGVGETVVGRGVAVGTGLGVAVGVAVGNTLARRIRPPRFERGASRLGDAHKIRLGNNASSKRKTTGIRGLTEDLDSWDKSSFSVD